MCIHSGSKEEVDDGIYKEPVPLCSKKNGIAFLFYAGAFNIDLFWGLISQIIEPFVLDKLHGTSDLVTILLMIAPLGSVLFSLVFGTLASLQQSSKFRKRPGISMVVGFATGLAVSSLLFSSIPTYATISRDTDTIWVHILVIILFSLMILSLNGYTAAFFSISIYFSNELISRPALPIWSALGQLLSACLVRFISDSSDSSSKVLIVFAIANGFLLASTIVSLIAAWDVFPSTSQGTSPSSSSTSNLCCQLCYDFPSSLSMGSFLISSWLMLSSILIFGLTIYMNGWSKISLIDLNYRPMTYDGGIDIPLKANLSRQFVQIFGSILLFYLEYYPVKWQIHVFQVTDSPSDTAIVSENLNYYTHPHFKKVFWSQLTMTITFLGLSSASALIFGLIRSESELLAIIGFAITSLGSTVVYSGRELQRSFFRYVRFFKKTHLDEAFFGSYELQDNICGAALFSSFVAIAQTFVVPVIRFLAATSDYREWFSIAGGFAIFGLIYLSSLLCCTCDLDEDSSPEERVEKSLVQSKTIKFRRDPPLTTTKAHHH